MTRKQRQLRAKLIIIALFAILCLLHAYKSDKPSASMEIQQIALERQLDAYKPIVKQHVIVSRSTTRERYTQQELILIAQLVHAEAEGEPYEGKVLVASVVMNRQVFGKYFGNTIHNVIFKRGQFDGITRQCFKDGIYTAEDLKAVEDALTTNNGYLYFCNPKASSDKSFVNSKEWAKQVGSHVFSK